MNTRTSRRLATRLALLALSAALATVAATACSSESSQGGTDSAGTTVTDTPATTPATTADATITLTKADNGKSFTLGVGDTVAVELEGNPTTGYAWESAMPEESAALLTLVGEPLYLQNTVGTNVVGAGGFYTFTFTAVAAGNVELKLKYWRSFEAQAEPLETFSVNLTIQ